MILRRFLERLLLLLMVYCTATKSRTNIPPVVLGKRAESFMFVPQAFSFENIDQDGRAICLGKTVIQQNEINPFISSLREDGIIWTVLKNHWLFGCTKTYIYPF
ncbi:DUF1259 domain-containing protein [Bacillus sp. JJ1532]|uniref:DUF1259 domain-containing protein n=1 Tax=Bacillus sp. JJ1532 TaxID=3122958 RepID=UPI002FFE123E